MVRSIEDCKSGVDALKEVSTTLTKTNQSENVLDEWYTEAFQQEEFFDYVPEKDLQLWIRNHKKTASTSINEALVEGMDIFIGKTDYIRLLIFSCTSLNNGVYIYKYAI
jgi:hypothetical protein